VTMFYFAWVFSDDTTFDQSRHSVQNEDVFSMKISQREGDFASLEVAIKNPRIGLLTASRKVWAWLSWDPTNSGAPGQPLFFGRLIGIPDSINQEIVSLVLTARPVDFVTRKNAKAEELRVAPYWDPIFVAPEQLDNPDVVLEARSALWSVDRITHEVDISDIIVGEDGIEEFDEGEVPYDSVQTKIGTPPLNKVTVDATVHWTQKAAGEFQFGFSAVTYGGQGLMQSWPKPGTSLGGGWTVLSSTIQDKYAVEDVQMATFNNQWTNKEKEHTNGDTMSVSASGSFPILTGPATKVITGGHSQPGFLDPFSDPPMNIPTEFSENSTYVPAYFLVANLLVGYDAGIPRTEHIRFNLFSDMQQLVTRLTDHEEEGIGFAELTINAVDVDVPSRATGFAVDTLTLVGNPHVNETVTIGSFTYKWVTSFSGSPAREVKIAGSPVASLANLIAAINLTVGMGLTYGTLTPPNTLVKAETGTGNQMKVTALKGGVAGNSIAVTETMSNGIWATPKLAGGVGGETPINAVKNRSYYTTDRGLQSVAHLIQRARATLLGTARPVEITFNCRFERAISMSTRKNARILDPRLPGGQALGKVSSYTFSVDGKTGLAIGSVTISCAIGYGIPTQVTNDGDPVYAASGYVQPGYQAYTGNVIVNGTGDVTYEKPVDPGLGPNLPYSYRDVVVKAQLHNPSPEFTFDFVPHVNDVQVPIEQQKDFTEQINAELQAAIKQISAWYELELRPANKELWEVFYDLSISRLSIPKQIDLESNLQL
jgi:hypothetical protein